MAKLVALWSLYVAGIVSLAGVCFLLINPIMGVLFLLIHPIMGGLSIVINCAIVLAAVILSLTAVVSEENIFEIEDAALLFSGFFANFLIVSPSVFYAATGESRTPRPYAETVVNTFALLPIALLAWIIYLVVRYRWNPTVATLIILFGLVQLFVGYCSIFINAGFVNNAWL